MIQATTTLTRAGFFGAIRPVFGLPTSTIVAYFLALKSGFGESICNRPLCAGGHPANRCDGAVLDNRCSRGAAGADLLRVLSRAGLLDSYVTQGY
jgi:hypothetical protein